MQNVSVEKFAQLCYIKDSAYIRQLLLGGKLIGEKSGKAWIIDIDHPINADYVQRRRQEYESTTVADTVENTPTTPELNTQNTVSYSGNDTQLIRDLIKDIKELSEEKGKTKLLTDNLIQKEHDVNHWQKQYFEIQHKYESLLKENTEAKTQADKEKSELAEKVVKLESEVKLLKQQKSFFGIKLGK